MGVCIQVPKSSEWLGLVTGVLLRLTYNYYWDQNYENWEDAKNAGKAILKSWFDRVPCGTDLSDFEGCKDFPLTSAMFSWYPLSPYTNAGEVPDGWTAAPFTVYNALPEIAGYQIGDVIASGFANPDSGDFTLPAFGIDVTGTGTVEIHLINALNGGVAIITVDGDLLNSVVVELNADTVEVPPENLGEEIIHEVKLETSGEHHIDVRFSPTVDDALIPVRFGGGLRSIVLCGFDEMMIDVRQDPENPCNLQKTNNGTAWIDFADLSLCSGSKPKDDPIQYRVHEGVTQWSSDGNTWYEFPDGLPTENQVVQDFGLRIPTYATGVDKACVAAANIVETLRDDMNKLKVALQESAGALAIITLIAGLGLIVGSGGFAAPLVIALQAELIALGYTALNAALTTAFYDEVYCLFYDAMAPDGICTASGYATLIDRVQFRSGTPWNIFTIWCRLRGPVGLTNSANLAGITTCTGGTCDWTSVMDFRTSDWGWQNGILDGEPNPITRDSDGWHTGYYPIYDNYEAVRLHLNLSYATTITRVRFWYVASLGPNSPYRSYMYSAAGYLPNTTTDAQNGYNVLDTGSMYASLNRLAITLTVNSYVSGGFGRILKVEVSGQGSKPPELP